jgi:signal peptidase
MRKEIQMKLIKTLLSFLLLPLILLFILIGALNFFSAPEGNGLFGYKGYIVTSGSMEPTFSPGDYIIVKQEDFSSLNEGDVITFTEDGTIVTHRVNTIAESGVETQGDANGATDAALVMADVYVGTLQGIIPAFGQVILFMQKPFIFPVLVFLMGAYVIFIYYKSDDEEEPVGSEN